MLTVDSVQILAAVRRSFDAHVLPKLDDDFARVQVAAALKALEEVSHRLEEGDPCELLNSNIESDAVELANTVRGESPDFASALDRAVAGAPRGDDPRERNRQLVEALWPLASQEGDANAAKLLELLSRRGIEAAERDAVWMCPEALLSLI